jgi:excisionase family DNA binding protein
MHRRLQFGMRENPASDRRHDSRPIVSGLADYNRTEHQNLAASRSASGLNHQSLGANDTLNAASAHAATGGKGDEAAARHPVAESPQSAGKTPHRFEPLIGSNDAARLLGNIHVKTLQRYARQRRIPGYQIGGHWYFRASELDSWLRSQINLSCHPCLLQEKSDGT